MPIFDFQNGGRLPSWIFIFSHFLLKIQILLLFLHRLAKFDGDWTIRGRVSAYFLFSKWRPSAILDFIFLQFCEKFKLVPISTSLCKIWWRLDDLWPSYCVLSIFILAAVHPRLVFDGPNILLKLHVDRFNICKISWFFYIWPVWLKIAYSRPFWGILRGIW